MVTYKDIDVNNAILSFTERKDEIRFLDILNRQELNIGDEITITIEFKGKSSSKLQFNRNIKEIREDEREINISDKNLITLISKDFIL